MLYTIQIDNLTAAAQEAQPGDLITSISDRDGKRYWFICDEENCGPGATIYPTWMDSVDFEGTLLTAQLGSMPIEEAINFLIKLYANRKG